MKKTITSCTALLLYCFFALTAKSQTYVVKSIKDFGARGNGIANDQPAFVKAALFFNQRAGNGKLLIPKGIYLVGDQPRNITKDLNGVKDKNVLNLVHCKNLVIEGEEAIVRFKDSLRFGAFEPSTRLPFQSKEQVFVNYDYAVPIGDFINLVQCDGVTIRNIEVDGNQKGMILGGKYGDTGIQLTHDGVVINNCTQIVMDNIYIHHMGRDGIMIANETPAQWLTPDQKIEIKNCRFQYNGRQGLSWIGGSGLRVTNTHFDFTGRGRVLSAPGAGIDIEGETGYLQNGVFENCTFIDNAGNGMVADNGNTKNMTFTNCIFWATSNWSIWVNKPNFSFISCKIYGSIVHGYDSPNTADATKYIKCTFEDKSYGSKTAYGNFLVEINYVKRVLFDACTFVSHNKKLWWIDAIPSWKRDEYIVMKNCIVQAKMNSFPANDFIAVMNGVNESGSSYEFFFPQEKNYWGLPVLAQKGTTNKLTWKKN